MSQWRIDPSISCLLQQIASVADWHNLLLIAKAPARQGCGRGAHRGRNNSLLLRRSFFFEKVVVLFPISDGIVVSLDDAKAQFEKSWFVCLHKLGLMVTT